MSAFEQLEAEYIERGMKQGIEKGFQQATLDHIRGLLKLGLKPEAIAEAFELPLTVVNNYICQLNDKQN